MDGDLARLAHRVPAAESTSRSCQASNMSDGRLSKLLWPDVRRWIRPPASHIIGHLPGPRFRRMSSDPRLLRSAPEDCCWIAVDLGEEAPNVSARTDQVVLMKPEVPVTPVQGPLIAGLGVAETCDREPRPLRSETVPPRRTAFENRQGSIGHVQLEPNLVTDMFGNLVAFRIDPTPNPGEVDCRNHSDFIRDAISGGVSHRGAETTRSTRSRHAAITGTDIVGVR